MFSASLPPLPETVIVCDGTLCGMFSASLPPMPEIVPASLWTRKDLKDFKNGLRKSKENMITVSSLATATVSQSVASRKLLLGVRTRIWCLWHCCGVFVLLLLFLLGLLFPSLLSLCFVLVFLVRIICCMLGCGFVSTKWYRVVVVFYKY